MKKIKKTFEINVQIRLLKQLNIYLIFLYFVTIAFSHTNAKQTVSKA